MAVMWWLGQAINLLAGAKLPRTMFNKSLLVLILLQSTLSQAAGFLLNPTIDSANLAPYMLMLEDKKHDFRLAEVFSKPDSDWIPVNADAINQGFSNSTFWFKIRLDHFKNKQQKWYLHLHSALLENAQVAFISEGRYIQNQFFGIQFPFKDRLYPNGKFIIPLELEPVSSGILILKIRSIKNSLAFTPTLLRDEAFILSERHHSLFFGICFGVLGLLLILALSLYMGTHDLTYLYYSAFVGSFAIWQFQRFGFAYEYLWPNSPDIEYLSPNILIALTLITALGFANNFLEASAQKNTSTLQFKFLTGSIIVATIASFPLPTSIGYQLILVLFIPVILLILYTTLKTLKYFPPGQMFFFSWCFFSIGTLIFLSIEFGYKLPFHGASNIMIIGTIAQSVLLVLAISQRINHLKFSSNLAKEQIIKARVNAKTKGDLIALMSHEIRTPLNGVMGFIQLLEDTSLNTQQKNLTHSIKESGKALIEVVNSVIDFAKIESGTLQLNHHDFNMQDVLDDTVTLFSSVAKDRSIELFAVLKPNTPTKIKADPIRIRQVLINLLGNAFNFTHTGTIRITVELIQRKQEMLLFKVRDTGIGIRPEIQEILTESFVKSDDELTKHYGGYGLSLNICKKLVNLMSGQIGFISEENKGSTFWFTLPLIASDSQEPMWLTGQQVYILGDGEHLEERTILSSYFQQWGAQIIHLGDIDRLEGMKHAEVVILFGQAALSHQAWINIKHLNPKPILICIPDYNQEFDIAPGDQIVIQKPFNAQQIKTAVEKGIHQQSNSHLETKLTDKARSLRILLAEDNPVNRMVMEGLLTTAGAQCISVEHGKIALEKFQLNYFDVILLDCEMPELDGYEVALRMRLLEKVENRKPASIIAVSAHIFDEHIQRCIVSGMNEHLPKPIRKEELYPLLNKLAMDTDTHNVQEQESTPFTPPHSHSHSEN